MSETGTSPDEKRRPPFPARVVASWAVVALLLGARVLWLANDQGLPSGDAAGYIQKLASEHDALSRSFLTAVAQILWLGYAHSGRGMLWTELSLPLVSLLQGDVLLAVDVVLAVSYAFITVYTFLFLSRRLPPLLSAAMTVSLCGSAWLLALSSEYLSDIGALVALAGTAYHLTASSGSRGRRHLVASAFWFGLLLCIRPGEGLIAIGPFVAFSLARSSWSSWPSRKPVILLCILAPVAVAVAILTLTRFAGPLVVLSAFLLVIAAGCAVAGRVLSHRARESLSVHWLYMALTLPVLWWPIHFKSFAGFAYNATYGPLMQGNPGHYVDPGIATLVPLTGHLGITLPTLLLIWFFVARNVSRRNRGTPLPDSSGTDSILPFLACSIVGLVVLGALVSTMHGADYRRFVYGWFLFLLGLGASLPMNREREGRIFGATIGAYAAVKLVLIGACATGGSLAPLASRLYRPLENYTGHYNHSSLLPAAPPDVAARIMQRVDEMVGSGTVASMDVFSSANKDAMTLLAALTRSDREVTWVTISEIVDQDSIPGIERCLEGIWLRPDSLYLVLQLVDETKVRSLSQHVSYYRALAEISERVRSGDAVGDRLTLVGRFDVDGNEFAVLGWQT